MPFDFTTPDGQPSIVLPSNPAVTQAAPDSPVREPRGSDWTVLVVDDDSAIRTVATLMLECHGCKIVAAKNGLEALQALDQNSKIDVVLLDLLMPVMNGDEALRAMRKFWPGLPVVVISGFDPGEVSKQVGDPGPDGFVQKPFTFEKLTGALGGALN